MGEIALALFLEFLMVITVAPGATLAAVATGTQAEVCTQLGGTYDPSAIGGEEACPGGQWSRVAGVER